MCEALLPTVFCCSLPPPLPEVLKTCYLVGTSKRCTGQEVQTWRLQWKLGFRVTPLLCPSPWPKRSASPQQGDTPECRVQSMTAIGHGPVPGWWWPCTNMFFQLSYISRVRGCEKTLTCNAVISFLKRYLCLFTHSDRMMNRLVWRNGQESVGRKFDS